jgi:putative tryptophan/tyrosine transport system substrate-binding protein
MTTPSVTTSCLVRYFAAGGALLMVLGSLFAWGQAAGTGNAATPGKYTIAIGTFMAEPSLDAVQQGLRAELTDEGFVSDKNVDYVVQNANAQQQLVATIANSLANRDPNVIVAITTPIAEAVAKVAKAPVVFAAVTDPVGAGLVASLDKGESNITGTSDAWPYRDQLQLIHEITPNVTRLGVLFNPGETASQYGIRRIREYATELGFTLVEAPVSSTNDVYAAARGLVGRVDALYLSSDNTVISGMAGALQVARQNKLPLYVGDSGSVQRGGLAAVSVGYYALGRDTGKLVARVLRGERNIPTVVEGGTEVFVNTRAAALMDVTIPQAILGRATKVFDTIE